MVCYLIVWSLLASPKLSQGCCQQLHHTTRLQLYPVIMIIITTICLAPIRYRAVRYFTHTISLLQQTCQVVITYLGHWGYVTGPVALTKDIPQSMLKVVLMTVFKRGVSIVVNTVSTRIYKLEHNAQCFKKKRISSSVNTNMTLQPTLLLHFLLI